MTTGRCEMDNREIGARIRLARRDAGLTQEKLAEKIGVSTVFVSQLESGSRAPGLDVYKRQAFSGRLGAVCVLRHAQGLAPDPQCISNLPKSTRCV